METPQRPARTSSQPRIHNTHSHRRGRRLTPPHTHEENHLRSRYTGEGRYADVGWFELYLAPSGKLFKVSKGGNPQLRNQHLELQTFRHFMPEVTRSAPFPDW